VHFYNFRFGAPVVVGARFDLGTKLFSVAKYRYDIRPGFQKRFVLFDSGLAARRDVNSFSVSENFVSVSHDQSITRILKRRNNYFNFLRIILVGCRE
jgi:hypothetical protein